MGKRRTRQRQLARQAARRARERAQRRRKRVVAAALGVLVALSGVGMGAIAFLPRDRTDREEAPTDRTEPGAVACGGEVPAGAHERKPRFESPPEMQLGRSDYRARIVTSCGRIDVDLFEDRTPVTVNNFVFLARQGFYDGLVFHRVIEGFMNQGGDPRGDGSGGPGYRFDDEIVGALRFDRPGLLAMANSGPDTNGSQFFLTAAPAPHLDGLHTIFGEVTEGMDVVREINRLATDADDRPVETVYIERVVIDER